MKSPRPILAPLLLLAFAAGAASPPARAETEPSGPLDLPVPVREVGTGEGNEESGCSAPAPEGTA